MTSRFRHLIPTLLAAALVVGCRQGPDNGTENTGVVPNEAVAAASQQNTMQETPEEMPAFDLTKWTQTQKAPRLAELTEEQRYVTQEDGTERAFTGAYHDSKKAGTYVCVVCGLPLYSSETKFDSGTGWPSYWAPYADGHVATKADRSYGWNRTELECARCDAHLGHVFDDGPRPTGERHCINSASLSFVPEGEPLK